MCPIPNPIHVFAVALAVSIVHALTRSFRASIFPVSPDPAWFALPVERLMAASAHVPSLTATAAERALRVFNATVVVPDDLDNTMAELTDFWPLFHRDASVNPVVTPLPPQWRADGWGGRGSQIISLRNVSLAGLYKEASSLVFFKRQAGVLRVPLAAHSPLVMRLERNAPGMRVVESRLAEADTAVAAHLDAVSDYALSLQLGKTVVATEFSTRHRVVVPLRGELHLSLFYPETTRDLHLYPSRSPRQGFSQLDFRLSPFLAGAASVPCATVVLKPGDALYVPPFYSVRSFAPANFSLAMLASSPSTESAVLHALALRRPLNATVRTIAASARKGDVIAVTVQFAHELLRAMDVEDALEELGRIVRTRLLFPAELHDDVDPGVCEGVWNALPVLTARQQASVRVAAEALVADTAAVARAWTMAAKPEEAYHVRLVAGYAWVEQLLALLPGGDADAFCALGVDAPAQQRDVEEHSALKQRY